MTVDLDSFLAAYDLLALVERDTVLKQVANGRNGREYAGPCPVCGGNLRFRVWPQHGSGRGRWFCRGCQRDGRTCAGDAITYLEARDGLDFKAALAALNVPTGDDGHGHRPRRRPAPPPAPDAEPPTAEWQARVEALAAWASTQLQGAAGDPARQYLAWRGLRDESMRQLRIGFVPTDLYDDPARWGFEPDRRVYISRGIAIPWLIDGQIWYLNIRRPALRGGQPDDLAQRLGGVPGFLPDIKYRAIRGGSGHGIYVPGSLGLRDDLIIVEGEFDAMLLWQEAGDLADVLALGGSTKSANGLPGRWLLRMAPYRRIWAALDVDRAGNEGARRMLEQDKRIRVVGVPRGTDHTEYYQSGGDLRAMVAGWVYGGE